MRHDRAERLIESVVYSPAAQNSVNSVMEVRNKESVIRKKADAFRNDNSASFRRVTPSTQVGRLSGSHFDIGFQLTQLPGQRKVVEPKGEKSEKLKMFEQMFRSQLR